MRPPSPVATHKSPPKSCLKCTWSGTKTSVEHVCPTGSPSGPLGRAGDAGPGDVRAAHVWIGEVIESEASSPSFLCLAVVGLCCFSFYYSFVCVCVFSFVPFGHFASLGCVDPEQVGHICVGELGVCCVFVRSFVRSLVRCVFLRSIGRARVCFGMWDVSLGQQHGNSENVSWPAAAARSSPASGPW